MASRVLILLTIRWIGARIVIAIILLLDACQNLSYFNLMVARIDRMNQGLELGKGDICLGFALEVYHEPTIYRV